MKKSKQIYWNKKQLQFINAKQPIKVIIGGRGSGKSTTPAATTYLRIKHLPRSKSFFAATTYNQILTKTLPAIEMKWHEMGLKEWQSYDDPGHYVVGRRPPKEWARPYQPPKNYKNVISFWNGTCFELISLDRPDLGRGGSYDGGEIDEAALLKHEAYTRVLVPSIRGNRHKFSHWLHHQISMYTTIPWKASGYWILDYEEKAQADPDKYFFMEMNAYDNIDVLGKAGIQRMKDEMPYLEFQIEVMNKRVRSVETPYYPSFNTERHCYQPRYTYAEGERGITSEGMADVDPDGLIDLSCDFGGWFSCATAWQANEKENVERCLREFFVKEREKVNDLVDKVCRHFDGHEHKFIRLWGEPHGHDRNAQDDRTIYQQMRDRFHQNGWECEIRAPAKRASNHIARKNVMTELFSEQDARLPRARFNEEACKNTCIAIQITETDPKGRKDKSKEKDRKFPQEHAPHLTDTVDNYIEQKHGWKVSEVPSGPGTATFI